MNLVHRTILIGVHIKHSKKRKNGTFWAFLNSLNSDAKVVPVRAEKWETKIQRNPMLNVNVILYTSNSECNFTKSRPFARQIMTVASRDGWTARRENERNWTCCTCMIWWDHMTTNSWITSVADRILFARATAPLRPTPPSLPASLSHNRNEGSLFLAISSLHYFSCKAFVFVVFSLLILWLLTSLGAT